MVYLAWMYYAAQTPTKIVDNLPKVSPYLHEQLETSSFAKEETLSEQAIQSKLPSPPPISIIAGPKGYLAQAVWLSYRRAASLRADYFSVHSVLNYMKDIRLARFLPNDRVMQREGRGIGLTRLTSYLASSWVGVTICNARICPSTLLTSHIDPIS
ncbi:unnamed protein product [Protopolystoma xenopodis]|uniref:Uncharacterized protein n=1 Tax=Protopolystoma xenopodis TaxID=117903 RepID=A0A3S5B884_9PLAT|nr:unnamed protein product [Protopolystoma xenopodis]